MTMFWMFESMNSGNDNTSQEHQGRSQMIQSAVQYFLLTDVRPGASTGATSIPIKLISYNPSLQTVNRFL